MAYKTLQFCTEAFDKPYKYTIDRDSSDRFGATWKTSNGNTVDLDFDQEDEDSWAVAFDLLDTKKGTWTFDLTGDQDAFRILATVMDIMKKFIKRHPEANEISFTASKGIDDSDSRQRVYRRMIKRYIPSNWKYKEFPSSFSGIKFYLTRT